MHMSLEKSDNGARSEIIVESLGSKFANEKKVFLVASITM